MAVLKPFKALRYNPGKAGDLSKVMAPPYDVISPGLRDALYDRHQYNVVRLILGRDEPGTDRYALAAANLRKWLDEGVLERDDTPAIYYYTQTYTPTGGRTRTRKGFIALARLAKQGSKGGVHAHEKTLSGPKADRLNLMKACRANLSCIFTLYPEPKGAGPGERAGLVLEGAAAGLPPLMDVEDDDGVVNRLWKIDDTGVIERVTGLMSDRELFIADGHHRYATALNYRDYMLEAAGGAAPAGEEPFNYVMMYFTSMEDEGLEVFPTHRVLHGVEGFEGEAFLERCREYFDVEEFGFDRESEAAVRGQFMKRLAGAQGNGKTRLGLCLNGGGSYYVLTLRDRRVMDEVFGQDMPDVYKGLDVTVLHSLVLDRLLGIDQSAQESQRNLVYVKDSNEAVRLASSAPNQAVFLMNPTRVRDVKNVSEAGLLMPQKSTYFYPKLLTGLVMNPLWD